MTGTAEDPDGRQQPESEKRATEPQEVGPAQTLDAYDAERRRLDNKRASDRISFRKVYAYALLGVMAGQLVIADAVFVIYGYANHWRVPVSAIQVWLAATVVEVIGVVLVIVKSLFPPGD